MSRLGFASFAVCLGITTAEASTIVVKPGTPIATIQQGINAAANGSTVKVMPGVYAESVDIPMNKSNVTLVGVGKVVIDARAPGGGAIGPGIAIVANGVTVRGLTIRHASSFNGELGSGVRAAGNDLRFEKLRIEHSSSQGLYVDGDHAIVRLCTFVTNESAIHVVGNAARVEQNDVRMDGGDGVIVSGNGAIVRKNTIKNIEDNSGISILGADALVESNVIRGVESYGIDVSGVHAIVRKNKVAHARLEDGIAVSGAEALVEGNVVEQVGAVGISVASDDGMVRNNVVRGSGQDEFAMAVVGAGADVLKNTLQDGFGGGVHVGGTGLSCAGNVITRCGFEGEAGIYAFGATNGVLTNNLVTDCGSGIDLWSSAGALATKNTVLRPVLDGIHIANSSPSCAVTDNVVRNSGAEGIDNRALMVVLTGNVLKSNRLDLANSGSFGTQSDNVYQTGGVAVAPEID
jgi:parallel beta-helix repeat protein